VYRFIEKMSAFRSLEVQFDGMRASSSGFLDELSGRIDIARRTYRYKEAAIVQKAVYALHPVRHFTKPHDIGPHETG
jgi:hypothetical protein